MKKLICLFLMLYPLTTSGFVMTFRPPPQPEEGEFIDVTTSISVNINPQGTTWVFGNPNDFLVHCMIALRDYRVRVAPDIRATFGYRNFALPPHGTFVFYRGTTVGTVQCARIDP